MVRFKSGQSVAIINITIKDDNIYEEPNITIRIKTHSGVSAAKKTKKDVQHTSVLFTGTAKLPNSAFCISKTTQPISTKFMYFMPYIYTTSHIKFEGNHFCSS